MTDLWRKSFLGANGTIGDAIAIIESSGTQICLVLNFDNVLIGTVTDGDVRRGMLRGLGLGAPVAEIMNRTPKVVSHKDGTKRVQAIMHSLLLRQVPIVDDNGRVCGLVTANDLLRPEGAARENHVVLMAGGLGNRLRPLTEDTPKPLLRVGTKPLLETILETFISFDFRNFYISVNYRADMVKAYFGDGKAWGCNIEYLEESERLGTAGPLGLIPELPDQPIIIMNGDLLTKVNFANLLEFHAEHRAKATMCVREYDFQVPYGVVNIEDHRIVSIVEKPVHTFFVNAGIYVLDSCMLKLIPSGQPLDMTDLFARILAHDDETAVFPIREYWMDIGRIDDFERANGEFKEIFG